MNSAEDVPDIVQDIVQELDRRIQKLESIENLELREEFLGILQLVDSLHRTGVQRLGQWAKDAGHWDKCMDDDSIALLFTLYDLVELDELDEPDAISQAESALDMVRPYVESHGGAVEILDVVDGMVHLRLAGSCSDCPASGATLKNGVEVALERGLPGFQGIVVHDGKEDSVGSPPTGSPPTGPSPTGLHAPILQELIALAELPELKPVVLPLGQSSVLLIRTGPEVHAFDPSCPGCGRPLEEGKVAGTILMCPWQNCAFDLRTGSRVDGADGSGLRVLPVAIREGKVHVATGVQPAALFDQP